VYSERLAVPYGTSIRIKLVRSDLIVDILETIPFPKKPLFKTVWWYRIELNKLRYACYFWDEGEWKLRATKRILWHCMVDPQNLPGWVPVSDRIRYVDIYRRAKKDGRCSHSEGGKYVTRMVNDGGSVWWKVKDDPPIEELGISWDNR